MYNTTCPCSEPLDHDHILDCPIMDQHWAYAITGTKCTTTADAKQLTQIPIEKLIEDQHAFKELAAILSELQKQITKHYLFDPADEILPKPKKEKKIKEKKKSIKQERKE